MTTYQVGETLAWGITVTDPAGVAANPGTGPTATVTLPDGTTSAATVTTSGTGVFTAALLSTLPGRYTCTWTASGANSADFPYTDVIDVWPATDPRLIISLTDARAALNVAASTRVNDDELRGYLVAAGVVIDHLVGTQLTRTHVEAHDGGRSSLALHQQPTAITTVVEAGTALAATDYYLSTGGVLWRGSSPGSGTWSRLGVVVTYTAGSGVLGENVRLAAAHLVRHWWNQSQQSYYVDGAPEFGAPTMVAGYAVPNMVVDLLTPSMAGKMPGFA